MIRLNIQGPARAAGIENAAHLARAANLGKATAYQLWAESATRLDLDTLDKLCVALNTNPDTLLVRVITPKGQK